MAYPEKPAAKPQPQPKPGEQKDEKGGDIPKSDWRKESEPHTPSVVSEKGTGGGQDSSPSGGS